MKLLLPTLTLLLLLSSCGLSADYGSDDQQPADECHTSSIHNEVNSVYYWKTVLSLDNANQDFIRKHNVGRIYMRMFDVVREPYPSSEADAVYPNATIKISYQEIDRLKDAFPNIEIVPVVYITLDALRAMAGNEDILADRIVTRVRNMAQYHELPNVTAMQLDCDWTSSTEASFFQLCEDVKKRIAGFGLPWQLSSTIRLHQLAGKEPPVDYGVLMVYNTGSFNDLDTRNSIICLTDIEPYLRHLPYYRLHLDVAYPTYSWQLIFRHRNFLSLANGIELSDSSKFLRKDENLYVAKRDIPHNGSIIKQGDMIRSENSRYNEIKRVKAQIEHHLSEKAHSNIIYHLDPENLSQYTSDELQSIFNTGD